MPTPEPRPHPRAPEPAARWPRGLAVVAILALATTGCRAIVNFIAVAMPERTVPARYDLTDQRVVVLCTATERIESAYWHEIQDLVRQLSRRLGRNVEGIDVVPPERVDAFRRAHPGFDSMTRLEIGRAFDADCVLELDLEHFTLHRGGQELMQGLAMGTVRVAEIDPRGRVAFDQRIEYQFPKRRPFVADPTTARSFVRGYVRRLADRVALLFYEHPVKLEREW